MYAYIKIGYACSIAVFAAGIALIIWIHEEYYGDKQGDIEMDKYERGNVISSDENEEH
jgi:hypothetical protein